MRYTPPDTETGKRLIDLGRGVQVESDVLGIVQEIRKRWPVLDVQFLDPEKFSELTDAPYRIVEHCADGFDRIVFSTWKLDSTVFDRIYAADNLRGSILERVDANNNKLKADQKQRYKESLEEAADMTKHILRAGTTYRFRNMSNELVTLEDDKGVVKRESR